jgi:hypothetical protein
MRLNWANLGVAIGLSLETSAQNAPPLKPRAIVEDEWQLQELKRTEELFRASLDRVRAEIEQRSARDAKPSGKIVNGALTTDYQAAGALIKVSNGKFSSSCSGTLIGCHTFLTAAHCVQERTVSKYEVFFQNAGVFGVDRIDVHPNFNASTLNNDVAVIRLKPEVTGIRPFGIRTSSEVPNGTPAVIVGFGRSGGDNYDYGLKRMGAVVTAACSTGRANGNFVCWNFENPLGIPGSNSNTCNGDSGGGLYVGNPPEVTGITSGGRLASCLPGDSSYDASVFRFSKWIAQQAVGDLAPPKACGGLPVAGSPEVTVFAGSNSLSQNITQRAYSIDVPATTSRLRITLNGLEDLSTDVDFNLVANSVAVVAGGAGGNQCESNGPGQYEACEIANPRPGPWQIVVRRRSGAGLFQVTATLFP